MQMRAESDEQVDPKEPTGNYESTDWTEHEHKEPREPSESYENTDCVQSEEHKELTKPSDNSENADESKPDAEVDPKEPTGWQL